MRPASTACDQAGLHVKCCLRRHGGGRLDPEPLDHPRSKWITCNGCLTWAEVTPDRSQGRRSTRQDWSKELLLASAPPSPSSSPANKTGCNHGAESCAGATRRPRRVMRLNAAMPYRYRVNPRHGTAVVSSQVPSCLRLTSPFSFQCSAVYCACLDLHQKRSQRDSDGSR